MRYQVVIDAIVRQTTVLIARLSTAEGARSPLGHIADEVFSGLVTELEQQGVGKKVVADMFGLVLRSYRQKVQRLSESATARGETLWSATQDYLATQPSVTRQQVVTRFVGDEESSVRSILNDLVENGFVIRTGRGEATRYRLATAEELADFGASLEAQSAESLAAHVWLQVYREGPTTHDRLTQLVRASLPALRGAVDLLLSQGRISFDSTGAEGRYVAERVLIPLGEAAGWEAAIVDHHRVVLNALAAKITSGARASAGSDEVGGTTLTFNLWPGHPMETEVRRLLSTVRSTILPLWERAEQEERPRAKKDEYQVHFYCGQYVKEEEKVP